MFIGAPPTAKGPAVSNAMQLAPPVQLLEETPTPQWVGGPGEVVYGPVLLATVIKVPAWEDSVGEPCDPLRVISMLLRRSPAERGLPWVSVSTTVSVPVPGVIAAVGLHASLQAGVPLFVKVKVVASALGIANSGSSVTDARPARTGRVLDFTIGAP